MTADEPFDGVVETAFHEWLMSRARRAADGRAYDRDDGTFAILPRVAARIDAEIDELSEGAAKIALHAAIVALAARIIADDLAAIHAAIQDEIELSVEWYDDGTFGYVGDGMTETEIAARLRDVAEQIEAEPIETVEIES